MDRIDEDRVSDSSSFESLHDDVDDGQYNGEEAVIVIDAFSDYKIVSCNHRFANLGGASSSGRSLPDWFPHPDEWSRCRRFIEEVVTKGINGDTSTDCLQRMHLVVPNIHGNVIIDCNCEATFLQESSDDPNDEEALVEISFSNLVERQGTQKKQHNIRLKRPSASAKTRYAGSTESGDGMPEHGSSDSSRSSDSSGRLSQQSDRVGPSKMPRDDATLEVEASYVTFSTRISL